MSAGDEDPARPSRVLVFARRAARQLAMTAQGYHPGVLEGNAIEQWNDPAFARSWAERNAEDNSERRQPLDPLQRIVSDHLASGSVPPRVLDLGCGHGVVAARILQRMGQKAPRLEPGDVWPSRLAGCAPIRQKTSVWNSSHCARPSSTNSCQLLNRSRRWRVSCDAAGNSTMLRSR